MRLGFSGAFIVTSFSFERSALSMPVACHLVKRTAWWHLISVRSLTFLGLLAILSLNALVGWTEGLSNCSVSLSPLWVPAH